MEFLQAATIIMSAAVLVVSVSKKTGFGSILGYIFAGLAIGPWGLDLITDAENILHFSELGVIFLLFIIGLELRPARLWILRKSIFGLGLAQVFFTTLVITIIARALLPSWQVAAIVGVGLSLSSTAFSLQLLGEKKALGTTHGRSALHILLFQDLAAIPALAIVPVIALSDMGTGRDMALGLLKVVLVLCAFWLFARYLLKPILRFVAAIQTREIFTTAALLLVLSSALIMQSIGVSMALGAFLAGVLVADSEYRHQLESDIEPFKGLLLGLFFMAVGMSANVGILLEQTVTVTLVVVGILLVKTLAIFLIGLASKRRARESLLLALYLSQGGEFGFILFNLALNHELLTTEIRDMLVLAVTLSMMTTPLLVLAFEKAIDWFTDPALPGAFDSIEADVADEARVVVAGVGPFGQMVMRILQTQDIAFTAIDINPEQVSFMRKLGHKVYYGDASSKQLLDTAGTASADTFVLAVDDATTSIKIAELLKGDYPNIRIFARAKNRMHEMRLRALGAECIIRENLLSSMHLAEQLLVALKIPPDRARNIKDLFYAHDLKTLEKQFAHRDDQAKLIQTSRESAEELKELFAEDKKANLEG